MLTGNTITKGLECLHLREGSRKSTRPSSCHLKEISWKCTLVPQVQEEWISDCAPRKHHYKKTKPQVWEAAKAYFSFKLRTSEFHHLHLSPLCTLSCSHSSRQDLPSHLKSLHPSRMWSSPPLAFCEGGFWSPQHRRDQQPLLPDCSTSSWRKLQNPRSHPHCEEVLYIHSLRWPLLFGELIPALP